MISTTLLAVCWGHEEIRWKELKLQPNVEYIFVDEVQWKILLR